VQGAFELFVLRQRFTPNAVKMHGRGHPGFSDLPVFGSGEPEDYTMKMKLALGTTFAAMVLVSSLHAETSATAWTDLNLRAGPGVSYGVLSVIPATQRVTVEGCLEDSSWCRVTHEGTAGWASGDYLTAMVETPIYSNRDRLEVETITYQSSQENVLGGAATGAIAGGLVAGPVGALIGAAVGMGVGSAITPSERVVTYVQSNPLDPTYLHGEVVVGAGVPEEVNLVEVPESEYYYAYINGLPVLVERDRRRVVYIVR